jgi:tetratricopeptide (TPR) repeat protein
VFLIAPKQEATGEAVLSVEEAKKIKAKFEAMNRLNPNAENAMALACIHMTLGNGDVALKAMNEICPAMLAANGAVSAQAKAAAFLNRGMLLRGFGRFKEAKEDIIQAREYDKYSAYIAMARAEEYLRDGEWAKGWKLHNQVRGTCSGAAMALGLGPECKFWDGTDHPEHLLVINEGGAGDRINFTRWLPELTRRGINWSFFCFDEFKPFYDRLPWIGPERTIGEKDKAEFSPPPSHWTTTFAIPGPLGASPDAIPPYPSPYTPRQDDFHFNKTDDLPSVGLAWNANELFQGGLKIRSLTEGQAMRLICMTADKVHWVNLQHGHKMPYPVLNAPFESWQDTAVVMNACDAVVSVDCGPLWLALAMEKKTAVLLSSAEDQKFAHKWADCWKLYRNGPSDTLFDVERAIDSLIGDIRNGNWPQRI